jgi:hypothetical protein
LLAGFGNTSQLSVELPAGLTYTSDSGVFPVPVRKPSSGVLLAGGLLVLLLPKARRRRS